MPANFRCTIVTPERQVFDEDVTYASIPAFDGQIGLAHLRAPLLAKLGNGPMRVDLANGTKRYFYVGGGFAQMKDDKLSVVTTEAVPSDELSAKDAEAALKDAGQRKAITDEEVAKRDAASTRARAMLSLADKKA